MVFEAAVEDADETVAWARRLAWWVSPAARWVS
jgi:hypothetical protein